MDPILGDPRFSSFLENFNLRTVTNEPTRIGVKSNKSGDITVKPSQIDHIIHQDGLDPSSEIIGCPFSDHKFLVASFNLHVDRKAEEVRYSRSYSEKNLKKVENFLSRVDFSLIERFPKIDDKWGFVKDKVQEAIDLYCPPFKISLKTNIHGLMKS